MENELYKQIKPFSLYQGLLVGIVCYFGLCCGYVASYPVFGQYSPEFSTSNNSDFVSNCSFSENETIYFDSSIMTNTIVTEYKLICDRKWINSFLTSIPFVGFFGGAVLGGYLRLGFTQFRYLVNT